MRHLLLASSRRGFTLLEIMIVVLIIGVLLGIAIPSFMQARDNSGKKTCISNLRRIENAKLQYVIAEKKTDGDPVTWDNLVTDYITSRPECPMDGDYTIGNVGATPTCTIEGHVLE